MNNYMYQCMNKSQDSIVLLLTKYNIGMYTYVLICSRAHKLIFCATVLSFTFFKKLINGVPPVPLSSSVVLSP